MARNRIARNATPPTVPPTMAPTLVDELFLVTGTAVVGVTTVVVVLDTMITDPPARVDDDRMTDADVTGGSVEIELDVLLVVVDDGGVVEELVTLPPLVCVQLVLKRVAVGVVSVTGSVTTIGTWVVMTCSVKSGC